MSKGTQNTREVPFPHNLEAERAVLGAILLDNNAINFALEKISFEDFYLDSHQIIFAEIVHLYEAENRFDLVSLKESLQRKNKLDPVGGVAYLASLLDGVPTSANVELYAQIVQNKSILRQLIKASQELVEKGYTEVSEIDELLDFAESGIFKIAERRIGASVSSIRDIIKNTFSSLEELYQREELVTGLGTGFADLDEMTSGFHEGELIIIAGRPGMGKTSFALNIGHHIAVQLEKPILLFSLEMSKEQLVTRLLCSEARISGHNLRRGFVRKESWVNLVQAAGRLSKAPIYIDDSPGISVLDMKAKCRRLKNTVGLSLVIVDYMQLIHERRRFENRQQEISFISRNLKGMAKELEVPVIGLSQLSREVEKRSDRRPQLSDLRESGAIEQDADLVSFLYRPEEYKVTSIKVDGLDIDSAGLAELIVAKQRNGPTGSCLLVFRKDFMQFHDYDHQTHAMNPFADEDTESETRF